MLPNPLPPILDPDQAGELLGCTADTMNEAAAANRVPAVRFGRGWRFPLQALLDHANDMARKHTKAPTGTAPSAIVVSQPPPGRRAPPPLPIIN